MKYIFSLKRAKVTIVEQKKIIMVINDQLSKSLEDIDGLHRVSKQELSHKQDIIIGRDADLKFLADRHDVKINELKKHIAILEQQLKDNGQYHVHIHQETVKNVTNYQSLPRNTFGGGW